MRQIRLSAHGAYYQCFHVVWIPKYRRRILRGAIKDYVAQKMPEVQEHYPDVHLDKFNIQIDHIHLIIHIPPRYATSTIVGMIKQNTSRDVREKFEEVRKMYWKPEFWSPGFFSSTVGLNEEQIRKYVEFQEKHDKGEIQMDLFKF